MVDSKKARDVQNILICRMPCADDRLAADHMPLTSDAQQRVTLTLVDALREIIRSAGVMPRKGRMYE